MPVRVTCSHNQLETSMAQFPSVCFFPLLFALLAGCSGTGSSSDALIEQMGRLEMAMTVCTSEQANSQYLLEQQSDQLERQGQKLDVISEAQALNVAEATQVLPPKVTCTAVETEPTKLIVGGREQVWLEDIQMVLPARVDTGAETASLDARNIELFERNGKRWVRFEIVHPDSGEVIQLERKLKRIAAIIQSNTSEPERRPVIKLGITIGDVSQSAEFTLSDRSHLDYQMLIGRNVLKDVMVVDVSKVNIASPVRAD